MTNVLVDMLTLAQAAASPDTGESAGLSGWLKFLIVVAIFVVPLAAGALIEKALKLKDVGTRIGIVLLTLVLGVAPFVYQISTGGEWKDAIRLGIDLAGGTNLVYEVDVAAAEEAGKKVDASMDQMVGAIIRRVNPSGTEEVTVRKVGTSRIEVIFPGVDPQDVEEMKRKMIKLGSLEFEILANSRDHRALVAAARKLPNDQNKYFEGTRLAAVWREVAPGEVLEQHGEVAFRTVKRTEDRGRDGKQGTKDVTEVLVLVTPEKQRVTGKYLVRADQSIDQSGGLAVGFTFNQQGAFRFQTLTSKNRPLKDGFKRRLAILLDDKVHSAPNLRETISRSGIISGNFTQDEISELISVLNAGALEIPLKPDPISEFTISPLLGADVQQKGMFSIGVAAIAVVFFMLGYYRFAGLVANLCLILNLILVLGTMSLINATFTLPGLAGLVLTIGMAVDANVLIFERIREETNRGSSLRMAIHNGFGRAFTTIVDANVTTLIVAIVLYMIGTDQVRGFAVTLFIGIVMSMYSALYAGRLIFDVVERKRWIGTLKMASIVGATQWDFVGKKSIAGVGSAVVILAGLVSLFARGEENLDIDFRGGTMVTFEFDQPQALQVVRDDLEKEFGSSITLERLTLQGEEQTGDSGRRYRLRTTEEEVQKVRDRVEKSLDQLGLRKVTFSFAAITKIPKLETETIEDDAPDGKKKSPAAPAPRPTGYEGGHSVKLALSDELSEDAIAEYLGQAIGKVNNDYSDPQSLFRLTGTKGSGTTSAAGRVRKFSEMRLESLPNLKKAELETALKNVRETMAKTPIFEEVNQFAKSVGGEMQESAIMAMLISLIAIVAYIWFRFQRITFGLAAVAALVHDVLVVMGLVALASFASGTMIGELLELYDFKINLPMIAAFLTIVGYSLNDTIVVFDRIREVRGKNPALTEGMVNTSLNQTLSRTLLTSITTFIVVAILYVFGGEGIHGFAFCLVLGVIVGTYSSIFVASPVLLWLMNRDTSGKGNGTVASSAAKVAAK